jgi:hypothetical protein
LLDLASATTTLLVSASEVDMDCLSMLALSPNETRLLIYAFAKNRRAPRQNWWSTTSPLER